MRRARCSSSTRRERASSAAALERERADLVVLFRGVVGAGKGLLLLGDVRPRIGRRGRGLEVRRPRRGVDLAGLLRAADERVDVLVDVPLRRQLALFEDRGRRALGLAGAENWPNITEQKPALPGADDAAKEESKIKDLTLEGGG